MAEERMLVLDALRKGEEPEHDPLREIVRWTVQELLEAEVAAQIGAGRYERSLERTTQRNGYRARAWDTRVGSLELQIPKLRQGSYFPSWLEPRRRAEQALAHGVPLVCIPLVGDQPDNAARVVARGAGVRLTGQASAEQIRRAIAQVVREPRFRTSAQRFARALAGEDGTERAVRELESLAGTGRSRQHAAQTP